MNADLYNGDVSRVIAFINSHNLYQFNKPIYFHEMYWGVEIVDFMGGHFFMNSQNLFEAKNQNLIYFTKKRDVNVPNISKIEDTVL